MTGLASGPGGRPRGPLRGWSPAQLGLRAVILLGPLVALGSAGLVGAPLPWWLWTLTTLMAAGFARYPESVVGTAVLVLVVAWWGVALRDGLHPEAILAAAGLLAAHLAALVASYGPDLMPVDPLVVRTWAVRGLAVLVASPAVWLLAVLLRDQPEQPGVWVAGLGAAVVALLGVALVFSGRVSWGGASSGRAPTGGGRG